MHILIAGGAGFIGSHLAERLLYAGHEITCLDNFSTGSRQNVAWMIGPGRLTLIEHDVCDPLPDGMAPFDEIYNLACPASPPHYQSDPIGTMRVCSEGTLNLLRRAEADGARFFHASTSEIYGDPAVHPQIETYNGNVHTIGPRACYDEGKRFAESLVYTFTERHGVDAKIARLFNTYGPRMQIDDGRLISNVVVQALTGVDVTVYGDGLHTRSLCYVDDTVKGIVRLTRSEMTAGTPINLGNPEERTVIDIVAAVMAATGSPSRVVHLPLPVHDPARRQPDIARAETLLGWRPTVSLEEGLQHTIAYFAGTLGVASEGQLAAAG